MVAQHQFKPLHLLASFVAICCLLIGLGGCGNSPSILTPPPQMLGATLNSLAADQEPRFSYDGRYLVFTSNRQTQRSVFLYDVQERRLIDLPGLNQAGVMQDQPDISADGRYIVYVSQEQGKPDVFVYDRQTFQAQLLTGNILGEIRHPTISGNGRFVAFEFNRSGQWDIEIYDRGSDAELSLPTSNSVPLNPSPSPDSPPSTPASP